MIQYLEEAIEDTRRALNSVHRAQIECQRTRFDTRVLQNVELALARFAMTLDLLREAESIGREIERAKAIEKSQADKPLATG